MVRVLLVDDEEPCRTATGLLLQHLGYEVQMAGSAEEALRVFDPFRHDLVVTDNRMPGMGGAELAAELKRRAASTPVVLYTGWPNTSLESVDALIAKPASIAEFRQTLSRLMGEKAPPDRVQGRGLRRLGSIQEHPPVREEAT